MIKNDSLFHCGGLRWEIQLSIYRVQGFQGAFRRAFRPLIVLFFFLFTGCGRHRSCIRNAGRYHDNQHFSVVFVSSPPTNY